MLLGYARVSEGDDQSIALQRRALADAGVERVFDEAASGGRWDRPAQRADVVETVASGRHTAAAMARLYGVSAPTVSRLVAAHRPAPRP